MAFASQSSSDYCCCTPSPRGARQQQENSFSSTYNPLPTCDSCRKKKSNKNQSRNVLLPFFYLLFSSAQGRTLQQSDTLSSKTSPLKDLSSFLEIKLRSTSIYLWADYWLSLRHSGHSEGWLRCFCFNFIHVDILNELHVNSVLLKCFLLNSFV